MSRNKCTNEDYEEQADANDDDSDEEVDINLFE